MFTKIFKSDYIFQFIFILIVSIVLFVYKLSTEIAVTQVLKSPVSFYLNSIIESDSVLIVIFNFLLLIAQALILKRVLSSNDLSSKGSLLSSFLYIIFVACFLNFHILQPILISNFILIIVLQIIIPVYSKPENYEKIFNAGALLAIASLINIPSIMFLFFIFLAFLVYSLFKWREWLISIIGFVTPVILYFGLLYLTNDLKSEIIKYQNFFSSIHLHTFRLDTKQLIFFIVSGILLLISLFSTFNKLSEKSIYYRKKTNVFFMFFLCSLSTFIIPSQLINNHVAFVLIPMIFFINTFLSQIKNFYISESYYLIIISMIIYNLL